MDPTEELQVLQFFLVSVLFLIFASLLTWFSEVDITCSVTLTNVCFLYVGFHCDSVTLHAKFIYLPQNVQLCLDLY